MSAAIKDKFLSTWDKDLNGIWKHIVPILPYIQYHSGNDAAATLCTFSKNWRTNRKEIRAVFDAGLKQRENNVSDVDVKHESAEDVKNGRETVRTEQSKVGENRSVNQQNYEKRKLKSYRPLSPVGRRRSSYDVAPRAIMTSSNGQHSSSARYRRIKSARKRSQRECNVSDADTQHDKENGNMESQMTSQSSHEQSHTNQELKVHI